MKEHLVKRKQGYTGNGYGFLAATHAQQCASEPRVPALHRVG